MNDKIGNSIAKHQQIINELEQVKDLVVKNLDEKVKFCVHTKELLHTWEPYTLKRKNYIDVSPKTMYAILNGAIEKEKDRIHKLIDREVEEELKRRANNK